jgi:uncharacterized Ntn-hydrolase superfamily protein
VSYLVELGVARDQKHISCDTVAKHLSPSDAIVAQSQKNPTYVSLDLHIFDISKTVEQVHDTFLNQNVDRLL